VLARDFDRDLRRWKFTAPITVETTVVPDAVMAAGSARELPSKCVNLLFLSRIEVAKGVFELLDAFRLLEAKQPGRYTLTFAGDGPALSELKERARDLGVENVIFPGFVTGEKKLACYRSADVFCFLSYTEGMPNAVLEALAMGLPIVSSAVGGLKDILQEDNSGYLVPQLQDQPLHARFSASEIADRIQRIAADKMLYRRISGHNRRYAEQRFAAKTVAGRLERIYGEVFSPSADPQVVSQRAAEVRT
jgi:glycosyltransferase involved in cell wall biosynthesis